MDDISMSINDDMYFSQQRNQLNRKSFYAQQIVNHLERFQDENDSDIIKKIQNNIKTTQIERWNYE